MREPLRFFWEAVRRRPFLLDCRRESVPLTVLIRLVEFDVALAVFGFRNQLYNSLVVKLNSGYIEKLQKFTFDILWGIWKRNQNKMINVFFYYKCKWWKSIKFKWFFFSLSSTTYTGYHRNMRAHLL